ncbi:MAG TPA: glycosyltransferase family 4 protein, partial [Fimbriimonas sp.]|nr:glycosyltransferase family 4 protein [Fimbriimonas sp.]
MRVVVISDYAVVTGGAAKIAVESALLLADVVAHVHFISGGQEIASELTNHKNVTVTSVGGEPLGSQPLGKALTVGVWNLQARNTVDAVLKNYDATDTIVAVHSWRDILTASIMKPIYDGGFRFAITLHDYGMVCPVAGLYDHKSNSVCERTALSASCLTRACTKSNIVKKSYFSVRHAAQTYVGKVPQRVKNVVVVTERSQEIVKPRLHPNTRYFEVPNPITVEKSERVEAENNRGFVYIGRLSPEKGPVLAAAAAKLAGVPISFGGAGIEEEAIRAANPEAIMLGWLKMPEVKTLLKSARALIFPSVWYECQGMVVDEAAAMGVPAIVADITTATTALDKYGHGVTFKSGDVEALAARIREMNDDEAVRNFSIEGHKRFWENPPDRQAHLTKL